MIKVRSYDEVCFRETAAEWAKLNGRRPFIGALTMELTTDADDEVASRRGLPREHRLFTSGLAACRSDLPPT